MFMLMMITTTQFSTTLLMIIMLPYTSPLISTDSSGVFSHCVVVLLGVLPSTQIITTTS